MAASSTCGEKMTPYLCFLECLYQIFHFFVVFGAFFSYTFECIVFSGPTYFMVLSREGAVDGWRSMIGPMNPTEAKEKAPET